MIPLLATLTVAAQVVVVLMLVSALVQQFSSRWRPLDRITALAGRDALRIAALVAVVAMLGSLYMSEVRNFVPCTLCWYQRIAMYPLALVLSIAAWRDDRSIGWYVLPITAVGMLISAYHYQLERFPDQETLACSSELPCSFVWFTQFGYVTLPLMAFSAFALIAVCTWIGGRHGKSIAYEA